MLFKAEEKNCIYYHIIVKLLRKIVYIYVYI